MVDKTSTLGNYNVLFSNVVVLDSSIGDHTYVQKDTLIQKAVIGRFCSISIGVKIGLGQHPTHHVSTHPSFFSSSPPLARVFSTTDTFSPIKKTVIGHDVWIGINALVMDGIAIGTGAIVAAGAVVTKDVPDYAIVAGVPAKIIKYRFDEETRTKLMKTQWWSRTDDWLISYCKQFSDHIRFLEEFKVNNDL
jgi:acetyltransferase-like isoleucine patch superfamily enzyme